jgi:hypothetical protein
MIGEGHRQVSFYVNPGRNTPKITPVAHSVVDPHPPTPPHGTSPGTHVSVVTMGLGLDSVDAHIDYITSVAGTLNVS